VSRNELQSMIESFIRVQQGLPVRARMRQSTKRLLERLLAIVHENRFSI
jgi:hypothetical protein